MIHVRKLMGVAGLGVLCAVGLGGTAQAAATASPHTAAAQPQASTWKYLGSYPTLQLCMDAGEYQVQHAGAAGAECLDLPDSVYQAWAYWA